VLRKLSLSLAFAFGALSLQAQPAPTPSQKELAQPLNLDDGKAAPGQGADTAGPSTFQAFGSLLVVLGLAIGGLYLLKKYGRKHLPGSGGSKLKVEETLALGDRRFVSILDAEGERFLIALHPAGISLLARLDGLERPATFQDQLQQAATQTPIPLKELEAQLRNQEGAE
jgi:flagellar biogenesis protein FliO